VVQVYQAKHLAAADLATAVQGFVQQEQDVLGETDDETSQMRRQERQISIEALGNEEEGSSQLLLGTSRRNYQQTMDMINELDRPEPQVMINVLIAEVRLSDNASLGIELAGQDLRFTEKAVLGPNGVVQGPNFDHVIGTALGAAAQSLGLSYTVTGEDFSFLFQALQANTVTEVLSRPILLVRNGQEGNITIADQVPFVESSQLNDTGSTNSVIGREDVGIILTVTPHISPDGFVTIALRQELSNLANRDLQLTEGVSSPVFQTREVETNVTVRDGETVVIGGLITSQEEDTENKVPILGDLPGIGALFRNRSVRQEKTELLIVLTVDILRNQEDMRRMSIEHRDKFVLPDSVRQSPLMEGLRIVPGESALGPVKPTGVKPGDQNSPPAKEERIFGPKPKIYGPTIKGPATTSTASVYGPQIVRTADSADVSRN
jgi:general secretion pathway protein D